MGGISGATRPSMRTKSPREITLLNSMELQRNQRRVQQMDRISALTTTERAPEKRSRKKVEKYVVKEIIKRTADTESGELTYLCLCKQPKNYVALSHKTDIAVVVSAKNMKKNCWRYAKDA